MAKWIRLPAARCVWVARICSKPSPNTRIEAPTDKYSPCFREPFLFFFFRQKDPILKFKVFSVLFSPTTLLDLFFPMNLHFCRRYMCWPHCWCSSDNHNAFILLRSAYHIKEMLKPICICFHLCSCSHLPKYLLFTITGNNLSLSSSFRAIKKKLLWQWAQSFEKKSNLTKF